MVGVVGRQARRYAYKARGSFGYPIGRIRLVCTRVGQDEP
jgi:hypothetical protein